MIVRPHCEAIKQVTFGLLYVCKALSDVLTHNPRRIKRTAFIEKIYGIFTARWNSSCQFLQIENRF